MTTDTIEKWKAAVEYLELHLVYYKYIRGCKDPFYLWCSSKRTGKLMIGIRKKRK